eukprot:UN05301
MILMGLSVMIRDDVMVMMIGYGVNGIDVSVFEGLAYFCLVYYDLSFLCAFHHLSIYLHDWFCFVNSLSEGPFDICFRRLTALLSIIIGASAFFNRSFNFDINIIWCGLEVRPSSIK